jgi:hypothetical protein
MGIFHAHGPGLAVVWSATIQAGLQQRRQREAGHQSMADRNNVAHRIGDPIANGFHYLQPFYIEVS